MALTRSDKRCVLAHLRKLSGILEDGPRLLLAGFLVLAARRRAHVAATAAAAARAGAAADRAQRPAVVAVRVAQAQLLRVELLQREPLRDGHARDVARVRGLVQLLLDVDAHGARALVEHGEAAAQAMVSQTLHSRACWAILPLQDLLSLGNEARFNRPGTTTGNWRWRQPPGVLDTPRAQGLRDQLRRAGRLAPQAHGADAASTSGTGDATR